MQFIEDENILNKFQSAFREKHSCETTINYALTDWNESIEEGYIVITVFLDLKRAFETVDRNRLLKKLSLMGINGNELKWFKSYLEGRRQKTTFQNSQSDEKEIPIGIPQGTQLSVILFILYINDMVHVTENASIIMFADDTVLKIR